MCLSLSLLFFMFVEEKERKVCAKRRIKRVKFVYFDVKETFFFREICCAWEWDKVRES